MKKNNNNKTVISVEYKNNLHHIYLYQIVDFLIKIHVYKNITILEIYFRNFISCEVALQRLYRKKRYTNNLE